MADWFGEHAPKANEPLAPVTINLTGEPAPPAETTDTGDWFASNAPKPRATDEERRTVLGFLGNAATSTGHLLGSMVNVPEQVKGTTALFAGMAEKSGFKKLPGLGDTNAVDALVAHYKDRYGSIEGFKKAAYEDPAGVMFDVATVLEPGAVGLKAAGLPRAAAVTTRAARAVNPVVQTIRAGEAALPYIAPAARAAPTAIAGGARGAYKAAVAPKTAGEAALGWTVSQVAGPHAGAAVTTALTGSRIARGAYRGAREALNARAAAAAEALRRPPQPPPVIPAERQLAAGAIRMPPAADTSYVRGVPAEYAVREPLPISRQIAAPPPAREVHITPPPELPPDASYVRGVPAQYPEVIPPYMRTKPAAETAALELKAAMEESGTIERGAPPVTAPEPEIPTGQYYVQTNRTAQALLDHGVTAEGAAQLDPPQWRELATSLEIESVPPEFSRDVVMRLRELEREAKPAPAKTAPSAQSVTAPESPPEPTPALETPKGTGRTSQPVLNAVAELEAKFPVNPDNPKQRLFIAQGRPVATLEFEPVGDHLRLKTMQSLEPGQGVGSLFLDRIVKIADKHGVTLEGTASPFGPEATRLNKDQLLRWYGSRGFQLEPGSDPAYGYIVRQPKGISPERPPVPGAEEQRAAFGETPPSEAPRKTRPAAEERVEKIAQGLAQTKYPMADIELFAQPGAGLYLERFAADLGVSGRPTKSEIPQIIERVRQLRSEVPPAAPPAPPQPAAPKKPPAPITSPGRGVRGGLTAEQIAEREAERVAQEAADAQHAEFVRRAEAEAIRRANAPAPPQPAAPKKPPASAGTPVAEAEARAGAERKAKRARKPAKPAAEMLASEINRRLDQLDKQSSSITDRMTAADRGRELPSETMKKTDPLAMEYNAVHEEYRNLRNEMSRRYGPGVPSRLPRGFGPIK